MLAQPAAAAEEVPGSRKRRALVEVVEEAKKEGGGKGGGVLKALVAILARLSLSSAAELRELCGVVFVTFLVGAEHAVIKAAKAAGVAYHQEVKRRKADNVQDPMGPPFVHVWVALLRAIGQAGPPPDIGKSLEQYWNDFIMKNSIDQVATSVRACRVRPTRKQDNQKAMARVTFAVDHSHQYLEGALVKYFQSIGGAR
eukprot:3707246-Pyramimonas_sp.AAC.1